MSVWVHQTLLLYVRLLVRQMARLDLTGSGDLRWNHRDVDVAADWLTVDWSSDKDGVWDHPYPTVMGGLFAISTLTVIPQHYDDGYR